MSSRLSRFGCSISNRIDVASAWDAVAKVTAPAIPIPSSLAQCAEREVVVVVECQLMLAHACGTLNLLIEATHEWPLIILLLLMLTETLCASWQVSSRVPPLCTILKGVITSGCQQGLTTTGRCSRFRNCSIHHGENLLGERCEDIFAACHRACHKVYSVLQIGLVRPVGREDDVNEEMRGVDEGPKVSHAVVSSLTDRHEVMITHEAFEALNLRVIKHQSSL